jgi:serine/threonine protein kinase
VGDFGSARLEEAEVSQTAGGKTLLYSSPELHDGRSPTKASDVWSLGVTIYELLTGQSAFQMPLTKLIRQVASDERPPVPSMARPELAEVLKSCWDKDPTKRMAMKEIVEKLSGVNWNLVEGADAGATKAFLMRFPVDASSSREELQATVEVQKAKIGALEAEIAKLKQAALARDSENRRIAELEAEIGRLRSELAGGKAEPAQLEPFDQASHESPCISTIRRLADSLRTPRNFIRPAS